MITASVIFKLSWAVRNSFLAVHCIVSESTKHKHKAKEKQDSEYNAMRAQEAGTLIWLRGR